MKFEEVISFVLLAWFGLLAAEFADPSDFFAGTKKRPRLKILHPTNGQVMEHGDLLIKIQLDDYVLPSQLHGSTICVGLSWTHSTSKALEERKDDFAEQCFEEVPDFSFQAFGLSPGTQYTLRISLYERNSAIAVSVRSFRVAGIRGLLNSDEVLTIQTAVKVAMEYQTKGMEAHAEAIYRSILSEAPLHADALHLLGVIFYQKGDAGSAVPYIERALMSNKTFEGFHNSLGVCYRTLGRVHEAEHQFKLALALNPTYYSAVFNLGLTYQHLNRWDEAIQHFRTVTKAAAEDAKVAAMLTPQVILDSKVRECDLLQSQMLLKEAKECWAAAQVMFPANILVLTELGNVLSQLNDFDAAYVHYLTAFSLGSYTAELNVAHILEIQGYEIESKIAFEKALIHAQERNFHTYHVKVRLATVLPRIMPPTGEIVQLREQLESVMSRLLDATSEVEVDNSPPLYSGYSTGFLLLFHGLEGQNNIQLKTKLFRLYSTMCPALLQGYFMELNIDTKGGSSRSSENDVEYVRRIRSNSNTTSDSTKDGNTNGSNVDELFALGTAVPRPRRTSTTSTTTTTATAATATTTDSNTRIGTANTGTTKTPSVVPTTHPVDHTKLKPKSVDMKPSTTTAATTATTSSPISNAGSATTSTAVHTTYKQPLKVRIGFVSRFMHTHPVGLLIQGLISVLRNTSTGTTTTDAINTIHNNTHLSNQYTNYNSHLPIPSALNIEFEIFAFLIDGGKGTSQYDSVQKRILKDVHMAYVLPSQHISTCAQAIRNAKLDILIYPEIGLDPLSYFLSYSRLAPVQAAWLGHPDTTAVPNVDYFISSHFDGGDASTSGKKHSSSNKDQTQYASGNNNGNSGGGGGDSGTSYTSNSVQSRYTEYLYKMPFFGTQFVDMYQNLAHTALTAPRTILLNRAKYCEKLQIPKSAHLYIIAHSLCKLNPQFDEVLLRILMQDRLAYLLIIDVSSFRPSWQRLLLNRIVGKLSSDYKDRIVFQTPESPAHAVHIMQMGHVLLDPFPVTGDYQPSLEALSIGLPVVTMPSATHIGGRFTFMLYHMLGYGYQTEEPVLDIGSITSTVLNADGSTTTASTTTTAPSKDIVYTPLVVHTIQEYVSIAIKLTHQPKLRLYHSERILSLRNRLFSQDTAALQMQWKAFAHIALHNATLNNRLQDTELPHSELMPDLLEIPVDLQAPPPPLLAPSAPPSYRSQAYKSVH